MVVSLVDEDGKSLKVFATSCLGNDLKDFNWVKNGSLNLWASSRAPETQTKAINYHFEIMWC